MEANEWISRVPVDLLCLTLLKERDMYGYEITKEILARSDNILALSLPTVYISLHRLEKAGMISAYSPKTEQRTRLYYHLEQAGREACEDLLRLYNRTLKGTENFFTAANSGSQPDTI